MEGISYQKSHIKLFSKSISSILKYDQPLSLGPFRPFKMQKVAIHKPCGHFWTFVIPSPFLDHLWTFGKPPLPLIPCPITVNMVYECPQNRPPPPNLQGRIYDPIWLKNICVSGTWITRPDFKKLILPKNCRIFITQFISNIKLSFISMLKIIKNWFNWLSKYIFWFRK